MAMLDQLKVAKWHELPLKIAFDFAPTHSHCNSIFCTCNNHLYSAIPRYMYVYIWKYIPYVRSVIFSPYSVAASLVTINFFPPIFCFSDYLIKTHFVCIQCSFAQLTPFDKIPPCKNTSYYYHLLLQFESFQSHKYIFADFGRLAFTSGLRKNNKIKYK